MTVAAVLGAGAGMFLAGKFTIPPVSTAPPPTQPSVAEPVQRHGSPAARARRSNRRIVHSPRAAAGREVEPPESVFETKPSVKTAEAPPAASPKSVPKTRRSGLREEIVSVPTAGKKIAITLDAGASAAPTPAVLSALRSAGVHVTFFLTGKWCEQNEALVREIRGEGHEIGNHTWSHPDLRKLNDSQISEQLNKTNDIVRRITGRGCDPYFRPPFGGRDRRVLQLAEDDGYTPVYWAVDSWDAFKKGITSDEIKKRVLDRVQGGDVILMHCGSAATAQALPSLIKDLQSRGFEIVKVSDLTP